MLDRLIYKELSYQIVGCAMEVHKVLGSGFLEKVYEEAFKVELIINFGSTSLEDERMIY